LYLKALVLKIWRADIFEFAFSGDLNQGKSSSGKQSLLAAKVGGFYFLTYTNQVLIRQKRFIKIRKS